MRHLLPLVHRMSHSFLEQGLSDDEFELPAEPAALDHLHSLGHLENAVAKIVASGHRLQESKHFELGDLLSFVPLAIVRQHERLANPGLDPLLDALAPLAGSVAIVALGHLD